MKRYIQILAVLMFGFCFQWAISADAPKTPETPPAPTVETVSKERDELKAKVEAITSELAQWKAAALKLKEQREASLDAEVQRAMNAANASK